ncbi:MAG TPA: transcriptional coactivator p15/PC4 family protein [Pseudobacteroides sp.]|uniref:transcriptional coactivator p15/PC4 family protein n=1 Tax=Pseudobacteroides sp. TaxID=1968840 RepID=UPI002F938889
MADFWDKEELIGKLGKNSREEIQIKVVEKKDKKYIDIRTFWYDSNADDYRPSQKGVAIPFESLEELKKYIGSIE